MEKKYVFLMHLLLVVSMSCMRYNKDYDLVGKKGVIQYPEITAKVYYESETELNWEVTDKNNQRTAGKEKLTYKRVSDELHFLNWIEKDGTTVSQIINTRIGKVNTFWSYSDEESDRGGRSAVFLEGRILFDK